MDRDQQPPDIKNDEPEPHQDHGEDEPVDPPSGPPLPTQAFSWLPDIRVRTDLYEALQPSAPMPPSLTGFFGHRQQGGDFGFANVGHLQQQQPQPIPPSAAFGPWTDPSAAFFNGALGPWSMQSQFSASMPMAGSFPGFLFPPSAATSPPPPPASFQPPPSWSLPGQPRPSNAGQVALANGFPAWALQTEDTSGDQPPDQAATGEASSDDSSVEQLSMEQPDKPETSDDWTPFLCEACGDSFAFEVALQVHLRRDHLPPANHDENSTVSDNERPGEIDGGGREAPVAGPSRSIFAEKSKSAGRILAQARALATASVPSDHDGGRPEKNQRLNDATAETVEAVELKPCSVQLHKFPDVGDIGKWIEKSGKVARGDGKGRFRCPYCGFSCPNKFWLRRHVCCVHFKKFLLVNFTRNKTCAICDSSFDQSSRLVRHLATHPWLIPEEHVFEGSVLAQQSDPDEHPDQPSSSPKKPRGRPPHRGSK